MSAVDTTDLSWDNLSWDNLSWDSLGDERVLVIVLLVAAVVLTGERTTWHVLRNVVTIAHEGGHAVAALLMGRELAGIKLHSDTSGVTLSRGKPRGLGMIFTAVAGYPAPSLIGVGLAALIGLDRIQWLLWIVVGLLAILLTQIRNAFGLLTVVGTGAAAVAVIVWGNDRTALGFACAVTWLLLIGGLRAVIELQRSRRAQGSGRRGGPPVTSDADQLAWLSHVPGLFWVCVFFAVSVISIVAGGWLMLSWNP
ncbi:M50 family metallopeptidase [Kineosporia sp. J2-2]|uniref:M50 family metallopeptidase n=1 Tax=Kineosporia corallincola TaxID=2835133 RepID=A0ABS5TDT1_9ACTN|nr:M50 family metallopeptidase [Kineosporia corallincola]MBT0769245.1 M50 family metallopeptidase [Kineosporia corallincola]